MWHVMLTLWYYSTNELLYLLIMELLTSSYQADIRGRRRREQGTKASEGGHDSHGPCESCPMLYSIQGSSRRSKDKKRGKGSKDVGGDKEGKERGVMEIRRWGGR